VLFVYTDGIVECRVMTAVYVEMLWSKWRRSVCVCVCLEAFALCPRQTALRARKTPRALTHLPRLHMLVRWRRRRYRL
jgi:hypothetical protein